MRRLVALTAALAALGALGELGACGYLQTKAVGDEYVQGARTAIVDVLAAAGLTTRTGPDCVVSEDATSLSCTAQTTTGARVDAHATGGETDDLDAARLTVDVDGDTVYEGSVGGVLARANE